MASVGKGVVKLGSISKGYDATQSSQIMAIGSALMMVYPHFNGGESIRLCDDTKQIEATILLPHRLHGIYATLLRFLQSDLLHSQARCDGM